MLCYGQVSLGVVKQREVVPYSQTKSPCGRKKSVATRGYACPHPHGAFCGIADDAIHALVGYGRHNHIQRFKCQACRKVFTSRIGTPLYYLKTDLKQVEMVLWLLAEGVDVPVMVRFTGHGDATIAHWLERMGRHSQIWTMPVESGMAGDAVAQLRDRSMGRHGCPIAKAERELRRRHADENDRDTWPSYEAV
jgi:transposase-like protein